MASTYTANKNIEKPAYNDYAADPTGWSVPVNTDWSGIDLAFGASTTLNMTSLSGNVTLTSAQYVPLTLIVTGTPTGTVTYRVPSGVGGQWVVRNTTAYAVQFNSLAGGSTVVVGTNSNTMISCDGTAVGMALNQLVASTAAGSNTQVQFNSSGVLGASANMTFDGTTLTATGLNAAGNVVIGSGAGSTLTLNPNTATLGAGAINIGSSTLYLNSGTTQVGIGTTVVGGNKLTVAGTISSTAGGFVFPDSTTQTTASGPGGSNTQVQFNNFGALAGSAGLAYDSGTATLTATNVSSTAIAATNITVSGTATIPGIGYVTMKQISSFPFSFSYTPQKATNILVIEVDIGNAAGQGQSGTLTVLVNSNTLNTGVVQQTNVAYMSGPLRVVAPYQIVSLTAVTIGAAFSGTSTLSGTIWMRVTETPGTIA